ncbi:MAG: hypothetical protein JWM11_452 [Planctomycetaceae bacterium]|nr:hypothetical protein [Planctomycetaceae bacterium]
MIAKSTREVVIRVTDKSDAGVEDALVAILRGTGNVVEHGRTDKTGSWRLRLPADAKVDSVFALKSKIGYGSWLTEDGKSSELPAELSLKLLDVQTVRIHVVDTAGKPVVGVPIRIPYVVKPIPSDPRLLGRSLFLHNCPLMDSSTNVQGVATFDWIPSDMQGISGVFVQSQDYFPQDSNKMSLAYHNGERDLPLTLLKRTSISGRVIGVDGKPNAGIVVQAVGDAPDGRGTTYRREVKTTADGTYQMVVAPTKVYGIRISDGDWTAKSILGLEVAEGKPVGGLDFALAKGTIIRGTITIAESGVPFANKELQLHESAVPPIDKPEIQVGLKYVSTREGRTNEQGEYRFRVVPGQYTLTVPSSRETQSQSMTLHVIDANDLVHDLRLVSRQNRTSRPGIDAATVENLPRVAFTGEVLNSDGKPIPDAVIDTFYTNEISPRTTRQMSVISDANGKFKTDRIALPLWLVATASDGTLAIQQQVKADQNSVTLKLAPAATMVGRLIDGDAPVAGATAFLSRGFLMTDFPEARVPGMRIYPTGSATTAADGRFAFSGLVVGQKYAVQFFLGRRIARATTQLEFVATKPGTSHLGYVQMPLPMRRPMSGEKTVPDQQFDQFEIDIESRTRSRFNVKQDPAVRFTAVFGDAKRESRRVLFVLGDPATGATQAVLKVLDKQDAGANVPAYPFKQHKRNDQDSTAAPDEFTRTMAGFLPVYVNVKDAISTEYILRVYGLDVAKSELPELVVFDEAGIIAGRQSFALSGDPPELKVEALREWVQKHAPPELDTVQLWKAALLRAHNEKKQVFLTQTGPNSYPSRLLTRFTDLHRELLERDYVLLNIDTVRSTSGETLIEKFRKPGSPLPWMAIINAEGTKLTDSDRPSGNISFPAEPDEIDYFIDEMLKPTTQRLTLMDLDEIRNSLQGK